MSQGQPVTRFSLGQGRTSAQILFLLFLPLKLMQDDFEASTAEAAPVAAAAAAAE